MAELKVVARIKSPFPEKFGIPRQSGLVDELESLIVMEPEYRVKEAFKGLEEFSHIWLIWGFSENERDTWSPTVRPPRLGGNKRMGVFATRSPFRPNPLGLSCVKISEIIDDKELGPVIKVSGADLMDGTPIYDIKPYLPISDMKADALAGFARYTANDILAVEYDCKVPDDFSDRDITGLTKVLASDPRPHYQNDPEREYGMKFMNYNIKFKVECEKLIVTGFERV